MPTAFQQPAKKVLTDDLDMLLALDGRFLYLLPKFDIFGISDDGIGSGKTLCRVQRSDFWLIKLLRRYREFGGDGLRDQSRAPRHIWIRKALRCSHPQPAALYLCLDLC